MRSYAAVDSIESKYVCCELEMVDTEASKYISFADKECEMVDIPLEMVCQAVENVSESDILVVEHEAGKVVSVYGRDESEKQRRIEEYKSIE